MFFAESPKVGGINLIQAGVEGLTESDFINISSTINAIVIESIITDIKMSELNVTTEDYQKIITQLKKRGSLIRY